MVSPSCTMRNKAVSSSRLKRGNSSAKSSRTLIPLRCENPSTYHRSAETKPKSSSTGGCSKYDMVRTSLMQSPTKSSDSCTSSLFLLLDSDKRRASWPRVSVTALKYCPALSCNSRAILRRSSSCIRTTLWLNWRSAFSAFNRSLTSRRKSEFALVSSMVRCRTRRSSSSRASCNTRSFSSRCLSKSRTSYWRPRARMADRTALISVGTRTGRSSIFTFPCTPNRCTNPELTWELSSLPFVSKITVTSDHGR